MKKQNYYANIIAGIAFCLCFIVYGTLIFVKSESIDIATCVYLFKSVVPYSLIVAFMGYCIGKIADDAGRKKRRKRR